MHRLIAPILFLAISANAVSAAEPAPKDLERIEPDQERMEPEPAAPAAPVQEVDPDDPDCTCCLGASEPVDKTPPPEKANCSQWGWKIPG